MPVDANGKKIRDLSSRGIMFQNMRLAHPDWSDTRCAEEIGGASFSTIAKWKKHPQYRGTVGYFAEKDEEAAKAEGQKWVARVKRRGQRAENAGDIGNALRSDELLAKHVPMEGLLNGRDMPGGATPPTIGQVNLNVIFANPDARRALETVVRVLESLSGGNGGQVVAGTVEKS